MDIKYKVQEILEIVRKMPIYGTSVTRRYLEMDAEKIKAKVNEILNEPCKNCQMLTEELKALRGKKYFNKA